ncbi:MAG: long-chain fatty acid--CoA ligase [Anaerolinea sp.]|nr:long-chain fatty acid--CoA ligase [Anaerolinea sp.]
MVNYAERPWLKRYDPGVAHTLEPYPDVPLQYYLKQSAIKNPKNTALVTSAHLPIFGRVASEISYEQLDQATDALAAALIDSGLKKGDRVALVMPNTAAFVISYFGILKAGGVVSATNPTYPPEKMQAQINDCGAEFVITLTLFYKMIKGIQARTKVKTIIVTNVKEFLPPMARILFSIAREKKDGHYLEALETGDVWLQALLTKYAGRKPNVTVTGTDLAIFQYTGGTTGIPKAAMSTHKALVANTLQCRTFLMGGASDEAGAREVFLGAIPFFHVYGLVTVVSFAMIFGARIILVPNARDIGDVLDTIDKFKPTIFMGVPALYNAINNHEAVKSGKVSLRSIRVCMSGSAPLPPATKREFEALSGGKLLEGFGMSEAPTATHANPLNGENRTGSIGLPFPDMDMRIVSLDDGVTDLSVGEVGELVMTGPQLMLGYHGMPTETANTLRQKDGKTWLYTGDIARMDDDGYFYIVDRKKDMALIGGFNVYPNSVEKVLADHPAVLEVGVAAVPHPEKEGQEALKAWVVVRPDHTVTADELIDHACKYLAQYEVPRRYSFVDALPKTTVGKTLRRELIQMEMAEREKLNA